MRKYSNEIDDLQGTGGELAQHLIDRFELSGVKLEQTTEQGSDHYDPESSTVRLSPANFDGKSLTAVAVAAHEVGHAIQFHRKEKISQLRGTYIPRSIILSKIGSGMLMAMPLVAVLLKSPPAIAVYIGISLLVQLAGALMYLIVLPEEWDASFNKALPILEDGEYLDTAQLQAAKQVLKAAALTYLASALMNVVHIGRWFLILRR
jgi:uncharacterized protein